MKYCLDTHILIWGIQRKAGQTQQNKNNQAVRFLEWLEEKKHDVLIPTPVLAEFLIGIPESERNQIISKFNERFIVVPFDTISALYYAKLFTSNNQLISNHDLNRNVLKMDNMIIAIAVANKADAIYSEDQYLKRAANGIIEVRELPQLGQQLNLI